MKGMNTIVRHHGGWYCGRILRPVLVTALCMMGYTKTQAQTTAPLLSPQMNTMFQNPPATYRGKPFWGWGGDLSHDEVVRQVDVFQQMGMGGFFMHSRTGLKTPYLGKQWFAMIDAAADEAKAKGIEAWLYDEDRWPSGYAGGYVTQKSENRMRFLVMQQMPLSEYRPATDDVAAFACDIDGNKFHSCDRMDGAKGDAVRAQAKAHKDYSAIVFRVELMQPGPGYNGFAYADTLNRAVTEDFLEKTHAKYAANTGSRLGTSIKGIFSDEPQRGPVFGGFGVDNKDAARMLPWTALLPEQFEKRYGYDLRDKLPDLFLYRDAALVSPVKWQYMELTQTMFVENWEEPIERWSKEHGLIFTGHALHEDSLTTQAEPQGSMMRYYEHEDYPGVDVLSEFNRNYWLAKQADSVTHQMNKGRTLSELYGATGWQSTFESYKWIGDWQAIFGINFRVQHIAWYTMAGELKRDYPASMSFQSAWWHDWHYVEDYYARLALLLTQGQPVRDVLVLNPVESVWAQVGIGWAEGLSPKLASIDELEAHYESLFRMLVEAHLDFDYGDEGMLHTLGGVGSDAGGAYFQVGQAHYRVVVVPTMTTMRSSTLHLLEKFRAGGGTVIFAGAPPAYIDASPSDAASQLSAKSTQTAFERNAIVTAVRGAVGPRLSLTSSDGRESKDIFYQLRALANGDQILGAMSMQRHEWQRGVSISVRGSGFVTEWDMRTGERFSVSSQRSEGMLRWKTDFAPAGERVYTITQADPHLQPRPVEKEISSKAVAGPFAYRLDEPNVAVLDGPEYRAGEQQWQTATDILKLDRTVRQGLKLPLRGGEEMQPWARVAFHAEQHQHTPLHLRYHFSMSGASGVPIQLAMEQPERWTVTLNGQAVPLPAAKTWWVDPALRTRALDASALREGDNVLELSTDFSEDVDLEAVYLLGAFGVELKGTTETLMRLPQKLSVGDLTSQGLPFYGGEVIYQVPVSIRGAGEAKDTLRLTNFSAALAKLDPHANGGRVIAWEPYEASLNKADKARGYVELGLVLTRRNTFGPLHLVPKNAGAYGPGEFRTEGKAWSNDFQLIPTGLLEAPAVVQYRDANRATADVKQ